MKEKKKLKLKKFYLHPVTAFILLTVLVVVLSGILSAFEMQATVSKIGATGKLENVLVTVENLFNYDGMKYIFSNAARNFISFTPLSMLLIALLGVSVAQGTGMLNSVMKHHINKIDNKKITFCLIFLATVSSLMNEIGYVVLIPIAAVIFLANGRNPLAGITAAFCGVAYGYGATLFVGSMEVALIPYTTSAARLIDETFHVSLTSNIFFIIVATIVLSIVGTLVIEKWIIPKLGRYKEKSETLSESSAEIEVLDVESIEQNKIAEEKREHRGLRYAMITGIIVVLAFIYMIIPGLPGSGMLLDMNESIYLNQLFGTNSYFQDGFTYMMALLFLCMGIAYGIGAKTIKNDRDVVEGASRYFQNIGSILLLLFFAAQFIAIFKKSNIGTVIAAWGTSIISSLSFSGLPLLLLVIVVIAVVNLFVTTPGLKWSIMAPVVVPMLMQSNISPQFSQLLLRAGDSMTNGITPLLAYFVIFIGYLNIYQKNKDHPITIGRAIRLVAPYCLVISITWILLIVGWYLIGLPIGPGVLPTI